MKRGLKPAYPFRSFVTAGKPTSRPESKHRHHRLRVRQPLTLQKSKRTINIIAPDDNPKMGVLMQTNCGSPCYVAPELMVTDGIYAGRKIDVWSCGVILVYFSFKLLITVCHVGSLVAH